MATLPSATTRLDDAAGSFGSGTQVCAVIAPTPGITEAECAYFGGSRALLDEHGYCQGVDYSALHFDETKLPILYVAVPIAVAGSITHIDRRGNTGTSRVSVAAGADGVIEQVDGRVEVASGGGGVVGTDQISLRYTLDGGFNWKTIRLGTGTSYAIPYVGLTLSATVGSLVAGDVVLRFKTKAPTLDADGIAEARTALAAQNVQVRTWLVVGEVDEGVGDAVRSAAQAYETSNDRFIKARVSARDRLQAATLQSIRARVAGAALTFANSGSADTITRGAGSWTTDGVTDGDTVVVTGAVASAGANNVTGLIDTLSGTVITFGATPALADEGPITSATVVAHSTLTFAAADDTITRSSGSFIDDGFAEGMTLTIDGSASNDGELTISEVSATVITVEESLTNEAIGGQALTTFEAEESAVAWRAAIIEAFEDFSGDEARRFNPAAGMLPKLSKITGWRLRRSVSWHASLREYKHDVHIPTWRVADGPLGGATIENADGQIVEHDERVDGGLLAAGFTCARTWNNEAGVFIALDLTRADEGSLLSRSHNLDVANVACTTVQAATQREVGQVLELVRGTGRATEASIALLESRVNAQVRVALGDFGEGPRATPNDAPWTASRDDILNIPGAQLNGELVLELNGTIEKIATRVAVPVGA